MGLVRKNALRFPPPLATLAIIGALFVLSSQPALSDHEAESLSGRFRVGKLPYPEAPSGPKRPSGRSTRACATFPP